eukprot:9473176-Pyramimonas_sp.AAC.1
MRLKKVAWPSQPRGPNLNTCLDEEFHCSQQRPSKIALERWPPSAGGRPAGSRGRGCPCSAPRRRAAPARGRRSPPPTPGRRARRRPGRRRRRPGCPRTRSAEGDPRTAPAEATDHAEAQARAGRARQTPA